MLDKWKSAEQCKKILKKKRKNKCKILKICGIYKENNCTKLLAINKK